MQERMGWISFCFPAPERGRGGRADPGGFPTGDGPVDLTRNSDTCLIELVENSDLPAAMPRASSFPLESGTIQDPSRMAGLKERAGIDLDSCFPASNPHPRLGGCSG